MNIKLGIEMDMKCLFSNEMWEKCGYEEQCLFKGIWLIHYEVQDSLSHLFKYLYNLILFLRRTLVYSLDMGKPMTGSVSLSQ